MTLASAVLVICYRALEYILKETHMDHRLKCPDLGNYSLAYRSDLVVQKRRAVRAAALVRKECAGHPHSTR
jgi:hypothetical protein